MILLDNIVSGTWELYYYSNVGVNDRIAAISCSLDKKLVDFTTKPELTNGHENPTIQLYKMDNKEWIDIKISSIISIKKESEKA